MRRYLVASLLMSLLNCEAPPTDQKTAEAVKSKCGEITFAGECKGNILQYCENDQLKKADCKQIGADCVWDEEYQYHTCKLTNKDAPDTPDKTQAGKCLACLSGYHCENNECVPDCVPSCRDKECGDNDCGGNCGQCGDGFKCKDFVCVGLDNECWSSSGMAGCPAVTTVQGCCDEYGWLVWCEGSRTYCKYCAQDNPVCGWNKEQGWYDCGTKGEKDLSGKYPLACPNQCEPDCQNKEHGNNGKCGDNGCGGSCGFCSGNQVCNADGLCQNYTPAPQDD